MDRWILDRMLTWFQDWVDGLMTTSGEDKEPFFESILEHTYRVRQHAVFLGKEARCSEDHLMLLELVSLFHDLGRFVELSESVGKETGGYEDHGSIGVRILEKLPLTDMLSEEEKRILLSCVLHHGDYKCPELVESLDLKILRMLRDADKIDGFYRECHRINRRAAWRSGGTWAKLDCTEALVDQLRMCQSIRESDIQVPGDRFLMILGYVFDMNYRYTLMRILENEYLERLLERLKETEGTKALKLFLTAYMEQRLLKE